MPQKGILEPVYVTNSLVTTTDGRYTHLYFTVQSCTKKKDNHCKAM